VRLRAGRADVKTWEAAARANGLSLSEYIRRKVNNKPTKPPKPEDQPEEFQRHPTLTNRELAAVLEAGRQLGSPGSRPPEDWEIESLRGELSPEELERYQHTQEVLATYDRAARERNARPSPGPGPTLHDLGISTEPGGATSLSRSAGPDPDSEQKIRRIAADKAAQALCEKTGILL